jgi:negative regulator of flagellin synthesis FlgM
MDVRGLSSASPLSPISRPETTPAPDKSPAVGPTTPKDEVEISAVGKMLDDASRTPGVREQRLAEIKAAIEAGAYETPEKLELALQRLVEQLKMNDAQPTD